MKSLLKAHTLFKKPYLSFCFLLWIAFFITDCKYTKKEYKGKKVLHAYLSADIQSFDPAYITSVMDFYTSSQVFETLLEYDYVKRPASLKPLLVKRLPTLSKDRKTLHFQLKTGLKTHPHPCIKGKTREITAADVLYSMKRLADRSLRTRGWWVYKGKIRGLDRFRRELSSTIALKKKKDEKYFQTYARKTNRLFPRKELYASLPMEGFKLIDKYTFQLSFHRPAPRFMYMLAYQKTAIVPWEVAEGCWSGGSFGKGKKVSLETAPAGTGPFLFSKRRDGLRITFRKNPNYNHSRYPTSFSRHNRTLHLHHDAGKKLPLVDILEVHIFPGEYQPAYLLFRTGKLDYLPIASDFWNSVFQWKKKQQPGQPRYEIKPFMKKKGFRDISFQRMVFFYLGFNFKDPIVGGYTPKKVALRKAISLAIDHHEINERFYNGLMKVYKGAIPPGLAGSSTLPATKNLEKAKQLLQKAGYKDGKLPNGKPLTITISSYKKANTEQYLEILARQLGKIGIVLKSEIMTFPQLLAKVRSGKAQMYRMGWLAAYPDAETFLLLFYGPNANGGANGMNFNHPTFNKYYKQIKFMFPSKERNQLYQKMNQLLIEQTPFVGSLTDVVYYMTNKRLRNFHPSDRSTTMWKYLDVPKTK